MNILENYLSEVATAIKNKRGITSIAGTDFASEISKIDGGGKPIIDTAAAETTEITSMQFSKTETGTYETVTLPHTCNATDTTLSNMYRGLAYYKYNLNLTEEDLTNTYIIQFEQVGQISYIYVNGTQIKENRFAYTPFCVELTGLQVGDNEIKIATENNYSVTKSLIIPQTADFSMVNGIYGKAYLIKTKGLYFNPEVFGIDKAHITDHDWSIDYTSLQYKIETAIKNTADTAADAMINIKVIDTDGITVKENTELITAEANENTIFCKDYDFNNPHL